MTKNAARGAGTFHSDHHQILKTQNTKWNVWNPGQVSQGGQEKLQADRGGRGLLGLSHQLHQGGD